MAFVLTKEIIMKECVKQGYYRTPSCNEKLYLHHKGLTDIDPLAFQEYTDVKVLWLESNCLSTLPSMAVVDGKEVSVFGPLHGTLRQLYAHGNTFQRMPNLSMFRRLDGVNFSDNFIRTVESYCPYWVNAGASPEAMEAPESPSKSKSATATAPGPRLEVGPATLARINGWQAICEHVPDDECPCGTITTLYLKNNHLTALEDIAQLLCYKKLSTLDLSHNRLSDPAVVALLGRLGELKSLVLTGNPCIRAIPNYRKTVIAACKKLMYLDDRPVFEDERRLVMAWVSGGVDGEAKEKKLMRQEEEERHQKRLDDFRKLIRRGQEEQAAADRGGDVDEDESEPDSNPTPDTSEDEATDIQPPRAAQTPHVRQLSSNSSAAPRTAFYNANYASQPTEEPNQSPPAADGDGTNRVQWGSYVITRRSDAPPPAAAIPAAPTATYVDPNGDDCGDVWIP